MDLQVVVERPQYTAYKECECEDEDSSPSRVGFCNGDPPNVRAYGVPVSDLSEIKCPGGCAIESLPCPANVSCSSGYYCSNRSCLVIPPPLDDEDETICPPGETCPPNQNNENQ